MHRRSCLPGPRAPDPNRRMVLALCCLGAVVLGACATGEDGVIRRGNDGGFMRDAGPACVPACAGGDVCVRGACVAGDADSDGDGVAAAMDCDDSDPAVGANAELVCASACGEGLETCTNGVWAACTAPATCDCPPGSACTPGETETSTTCGFCGVLERTCQDSCTWGEYACTDEGVCMAGATDTDTQACPGGCGNTQSRTRTCDGTCAWGDYSAFSACVPCGPVCGDMSCESGETCESCPDCQNGHLGTGDDGDSCAGVPAETWRCVNSARWGTTISQFCRDGTWGTFHLTPRDCNACVCSYSLACRREGV